MQTLKHYSFVAVCVVVALIFALFLGNAVSAQESHSGAVSGSAAKSTSGANSVSALVQNNYGSDSLTYGGSYDVTNVPGGVVGPSFSSGHPCAYSPVSIGLAVIGAGASVGGQTIDDACMLAQMGQMPAAVAMIASRNGSACRALRSAGSIAASSRCAGDRVKKAIASSQGTVRKTSGNPLYNYAKR